MTESRAKRGRPRQGRAVARELPRDEEILRIAAEVLHRRGFDGTRLDDIAREAGIAKGSLYHYFDSKEEIYERLVANVVGTLAGDVVASTRGTPSEKMERIVERWVSQVAEYPLEVGLLYRQLVHLEGPGGEWARAVRRDNVARLREAIIAGQASGEFRDGDLEVLAHQVMGSIAALTDWYKPDGQVKVDALVPEVTAFIMAGLEKR